MHRNRCIARVEGAGRVHALQESKLVGSPQLIHHHNHNMKESVESHKKYIFIAENSPELQNDPFSLRYRRRSLSCDFG